MFRFVGEQDCERPFIKNIEKCPNRAARKINFLNLRKKSRDSAKKVRDKTIGRMQDIFQYFFASLKYNQFRVFSEMTC